MNRPPITEVTFPEPKRRWPWLAGGLVVVAGAGAGLGWALWPSGDDPSIAASPSLSASPSTGGTPQPSSSSEEPVQTPTEVASVIPPAAVSLDQMPNVLAVGQDIGPGVYRAQSAQQSCSWARVRDDGTTQEVLASATTSGQAVVSIVSTDSELHSMGCGPFEPVGAPMINPTFADGDTIVGTDIAAGTYTATTPSDSCIWQRTARTMAGVVSVTDSGSSAGEAVQVTIPGSDFVFTSAGCGTWTLAR